MGAIHGKGTYVAFDDASGALVPLSAYFKQAGANRSIDTAESSTFSQSAKTYVLGMNDETVDISGNFDPTLHTHMTLLMAALDDGSLDACTVVVGPAGNAVGKPMTQRECLVKSYNWSASNSDVVTAAISFQRTGPNADGVFS
jgi:hypothetical protein